MVSSHSGSIDGVQVADYRTTNTGDLTYLLVSAVQQLSKKVKDLETQISGSN